LLPVGPLNGEGESDEVSSAQRFRPTWTPPARF
jgi:hypothetical protein